MSGPSSASAIRTLEIATRLPVSPDALWADVTSFAAINRELAPLLRMTVPPGAHGADDLRELRAGAALGRSWLLLGGLLPVEFDRITIAEIGPGHRFDERSSMAAMRVWRHEREVTECPGGSELRDRLGFELRRPLARAPGSAALAVAIVGRVFAHRHRRLARRYGRIG